jgi:hypothetical protein
MFIQTVAAVQQLHGIVRDQQQHIEDLAAINESKNAEIAALSSRVSELENLMRAALATRNGVVR